MALLSRLHGSVFRAVQRLLILCAILIFVACPDVISAKGASAGSSSHSSGGRRANSNGGQRPSGQNVLEIASPGSAAGTPRLRAEESPVLMAGEWNRPVVSRSSHHSHSRQRIVGLGLEIPADAPHQAPTASHFRKGKGMPRHSRQQPLMQHAKRQAATAQDEDANNPEEDGATDPSGAGAATSSTGPSDSEASSSSNQTTATSETSSQPSTSLSPSTAAHRQKEPPSAAIPQHPPNGETPVPEPQRGSTFNKAASYGGAADEGQSDPQYVQPSSSSSSFASTPQDASQTDHPAAPQPAVPHRKAHPAPEQHGSHRHSQSHALQHKSHHDADPAYQHKQKQNRHHEHHHKSIAQARKRLMKRYHGEGTYYNAGISEGACGGWHKSSELVAAVSRQQWHGGEFCNQMLHVCHHGKCTDVQVVDECPSCDYGSLDLSPTAFKQLAPMSEGVIDINWTFA